MLVRLIVAMAAVATTACRPYYNAGFIPRVERVFRWTWLRTIHHDSSSFTQGLGYADGYLFESAGGPGVSRILKIDATTGSTRLERPWPLRSPFAEGLAIDGDTIVQLSWKNGRALTWSRGNLQRGRDIAYDGDGWGLCFDGSGYWRSDGTSRLRRHTRDTFLEESGLEVVTAHGERVTYLNELECIGEHVLANVWQTPYVVVIRARDGIVVGALDFTPLVDNADASGRESVLNGLAWDPARRELYVTGKRWNKTYVVELHQQL